MDQLDQPARRPSDDASAALEQPEAEALIKRERDFSNALLDSLPGVFYLYDEDLHFLRWNKNFEKVTGYTGAEIARMSPLDFFHGEERALLLERIERVFTEGGATVEAHFTAKDGTQTPYFFTGRRTTLDGRPCLIGVGVDITELERVRRLIATSERRLSLIFDTVGDVMFLLAVEPGGLYRFEAVNASFLAVTGLRRELVVGKRVEEVLPPSAHELVLSRYAQAIGEGATVRWEEVSAYPTGTLYGMVSVTPACDADGNVTHLIGSVHDITQVRRAEEEIRALNQELEDRVRARTHELSTILEVSHTVASTLDLQQLMGLILDQLHRLVHYTRASLVCTNGTIMTVGGDRVEGPHPWLHGQQLNLEGDQLVYAALMGGEPLVVEDVRAELDPAGVAARLLALLPAQLPPHSGQVASWMVVPLLIKDQLIGLLSMSHVTPGFFSRRDAELARALCDHAAIALENARLYQEAQALAVLKERQRLARDLHDAVTQTLFSASLISEVMPRLWESDPERGRRSLESLRRLTRGALAEMRTLLLELRPEALETTPLDELLRQLAQTIHSRSQAQLALELAPAPLLPPEIQLGIYRIAQEAINNSLKHAEAGTISLELAFPAGALLLLVRDDGAGFDPARVPANHFGLSIMSERAEAIGAELRVHSRPGEGTTVELRWDGPRS